MSLTNKQLDQFHRAAQSLKLYRRAELISDKDGNSLIRDLYVDPLPNNHILETIMRSNTTLLIGRKGTGKSTIFQRAQAEIQSDKIDSISAYIDIKTVFEQSRADPILVGKVASLPEGMTGTSIEQLLLNRNFIASLIREIKSELSKRLKLLPKERFKNTFFGTIDDLFYNLDELLEEAYKDNFTSVNGILNLSVEEARDSKTSNSSTASVGGEIDKGVKFNVNIEGSALSEISSQHADKYGQILLRIFNLPAIIQQLKNILGEAKIRHLYVFIDDFSELPEQEMKAVVDTVITPFNNWSNELIKFKIAAYPHRIYLGEIDRTKIDEINLDSYSLYGSSDITTMEEKSIDFTKRLVYIRLKHYIKDDLDIFFDDNNDIWKYLYFSTMANPRNLGYILFYLYEEYLLYGKKISLRAIREAAQRYYEEKIESYFRSSKFLHDSFNERSSIYSLKELLEKIVGKARDLKSYSGSAVIKSIKADLTRYDLKSL